MKSRLLCAVCTMLLVLPFSSAHAALIEIEWEGGAFGNTDLTRDTLTGIDWLDVTKTLNVTVNDTIAGFGGYISSGFRYASLQEVEDLFVSVGILINTPLNTASFAGAVQLIDLLGCTLVDCSGADTPRLQGFAGLNEPGAGLAYVPAVLATLSAGTGVNGPNAIEDFNFIPHAAGSFLVRDTTVPIPPAAFLFGSGLIGLVAVARRKAA